MPCTHKFADYLNLNGLDFEPTTLIIGTFNPGWVEINNNADWFYGRTRNNYFWDVLPRIYEGVNLRQQNSQHWKEFCSRNSIALTDLLFSIDDADVNNPAHLESISNYKDSDIATNFHQFTPVNVLAILQNNPTINRVYLTRQLGSDFWDNYWNIIVQYCQNHNITTQELLTPSANARFQMNGGQLRDFIYNSWLPVWHPII